MSKPWCYVKDHVKEVCQLQQCGKLSSKSKLLLQHRLIFFLLSSKELLSTLDYRFRQ